MTQENSVHWPELEKFYNWQKPSEEATTDEEYYLGTAKEQLPRMELALKVALRRAEKLLDDPERIEIFNARVTEFYEQLAPDAKVEDFLITPQKIKDFKQRQFTVVPENREDSGFSLRQRYREPVNESKTQLTDKFPRIYAGVFDTKHVPVKNLVTSFLHEIGHNATNMASYRKNPDNEQVAQQYKKFNHMHEYAADLFADICAPNWNMKDTFLLELQENIETKVFHEKNLIEIIGESMAERRKRFQNYNQRIDSWNKDTPEKLTPYMNPNIIADVSKRDIDTLEKDSDSLIGGLTHPATAKRGYESDNNVALLTTLRTNRYIEDMYGVSAEDIAKEAERYNPKPKVDEVPQAEKPDWVEQAIIAAEVSVPEVQKTPSLLMRFASNAWQVLEKMGNKLDQKAKDFSPYSDIQEQFQINKAITVAAKMGAFIVPAQVIINQDENPIRSLVIGLGLSGAMSLYAEAKEFLLKRESNKRNQAQTIRSDM